MADRKGNLVEVCWERCRCENAQELLKRWLPIIGKYARIFDIKIIVDLPNGEQSAIGVGEGEPVFYLHLNGYCPSDAKTKNIKNPSFFGFSVSGDVGLRDIEVRHLGMGVVVPQGIVIKSPENIPVGFISSGNIYIHPHVLGNPYWPDNQDLHILEQILYWTFPKIIVPKYDMEKIDQDYARGYQLLRQGMRGRLRSKRGRKLRETIESFLRQGLKVNSENLYRDLEEIKKEASMKRSEYFKKLEAIYNLEERLGLAIKRNEVRDFGQEFEKLLQMDAVLSVKIEKKEKDSYLVVRTGKILQTLNDGTAYDIGEFDIVIYPEPKKGSIHFYQNRYLGYYKHLYATISNTCYGTSNTEGLNHDVEKLISRFEIVPLVHLLLTFLAKESSTPSRRPEVTGPQIYSDFSYTPEEKEEDRRNFIDFMAETSLKLSTTELSVTLSKETESLEKIREERIRLRVEMEGVEDSIRVLESRIANDSNHLREESGRLISNDNVFWLAGDQHEIQIHFEVAPIGGVSRDTKLQGCILRIGRSQALEIFYSPPYLVTRLFELSHARHTKLSAQVEKELYGLKFQGKISELVSRVRNLISDGLLDSSGM